MTPLIRLRDLFGRLLTKDREPRVGIPSADLAQGPVYCVGDVHGCLSLYKELEAQIVRDCASLDGVATIVLLGDVIDRGLTSAGVIDHLLSAPPAGLQRLSLRGNHEAMMLAYLEAPLSNSTWLEFGGRETLVSYGIYTEPTSLQRMSERKLRQLLAASIPQEHIEFLRNTLPGLQVGPYLLAHAGAEAQAPLSAQSWNALLWGNAGQIAPDLLTLVHGHFIMEQVTNTENAFAIDTGAYATGRLTALRLTVDAPPAYFTTTQMTEFQTLQM
jgi:serine/threonine protein phosphatase 1